MKDTGSTDSAVFGTRPDETAPDETATDSLHPCNISEVIGVLFDFDGVLVDSGTAHRESWKIAFRTVLDRDMPDYPKSEITGMSTIEIGQSLAKKIGAPEKAQALAEAKIHEIVYGDLLPGLLPGAREVTEALTSRGIPYGIASNAPGAYVRRVADEHGLNAEVVLGFEDLPRPKPDPSAYTTCASRLGFRHEHYPRLLVCEDSTPGLRAGVSAGMRSLGITTTLTDTQLRSQGADCVARDLLDARAHIAVFS